MGEEPTLFEDELVGTLFAGRFRIRSLLGSGGMGTVYLATHEVLRRDVAVKLLHPRLLGETKVMASFAREARAASRIDHPNVTRIFDFGHSEEGLPYLAMEYAPGSTLSQVLADEGPFAVPRAVSVLRQVAEGLAAAHAAGVVHRDLKPRNIVLQDDASGAGGAIKILDFGLAKIIDPEAGTTLTTLGSAFGTPKYMSPEQIQAEPVDHRTDIYTFGVLAFELLVGRGLFDGSTIEIIRAHLGRDPLPPAAAAKRADIPPALDELILRCLAKQPQARVQQASELRAALLAIERTQA